MPCQVCLYQGALIENTMLKLQKECWPFQQLQSAMHVFGREQITACKTLKYAK